jgi:hypothetical protein
MTIGEGKRSIRDRRPYPKDAFAAFCILALALCPIIASSAAMDRTKVASTTAELLDAIQSARPGDTIRVKAGTYVGLVISHVNFSDPIKVTSLDPAHPAIISGVKIAASSGLKFSQMEFESAGSTDPTYSYRVTGCENLVFDDMIFHGNRAVPPSMERAGFFITDSTNIKIYNSRFDHMGAGVVANRNNNIEVRRNLFMQMSKGGIEMGADGFVALTDNVFTDFQVGRGVHPDGIQIYTATMPTPSHDISVIGNLFYRGRGDAIQGIFIQDEGTMSPFHNLTVANNAIIGGMWDSLYFRHVTGSLVIKDNIAASWAAVDMEGSGDAAAAKTKPTTTNFAAYLWLRGDNSGATLSMTGNQAQVYLGNAGRIAPPPGNKELGGVTDDGKALLKAWMTGHPQLLPLLAAANLP